MGWFHDKCNKKEKKKKEITKEQRPNRALFFCGKLQPDDYEEYMAREMWS